MAARPDYYRILGVASYSEEVVIQAAYRALMRRYHPDTNSSPDAQQRATEINEAYAVLNNIARRRQYDAERKAARARSGTESQKKSPNSSTSGEPRSPPRKAATPPSAPVQHATKENYRVLAAVGGIILMLIAIGVATDQGANSAAPPIYVDNLVGDDVITIDAEIFSDANLIASDAAPVPVKLAELPQHEPIFADIESAASRFARTLLRDGMMGAREFSEKCHRDVVKAPSWSAADRCAAFDFAAAYLDDQITRGAAWTRNAYFQFQAENQSDRYNDAGAAQFTVLTRLSKIKRAAEQAAEWALRIELAKQTPANAPSADRPQSAPPARSDSPPSDNEAAGNDGAEERFD